MFPSSTSRPALTTKRLTISLVLVAPDVSFLLHHAYLSGSHYQRTHNLMFCLLYHFQLFPTDICCLLLTSNSLYQITHNLPCSRLLHHVQHSPPDVSRPLRVAPFLPTHLPAGSPPSSWSQHSRFLIHQS